MECHCTSLEKTVDYLIYGAVKMVVSIEEKKCLYHTTPK